MAFPGIIAEFRIEDYLDAMIVFITQQRGKTEVLGEVRTGA